MNETFYILYLPSADMYVDEYGYYYADLESMVENGIKNLDDTKELLSSFTGNKYEGMKIVKAEIKVDMTEVDVDE